MSVINYTVFLCMKIISERQTSMLLLNQTERMNFFMHSFSKCINCNTKNKHP